MKYIKYFESNSSYPNFDWWDLDKDKPIDRKAPEHGYQDLFTSILGNVDKLKNALDNTDYKI